MFVGNFATVALYPKSAFECTFCLYP